MRSQNLPIRTKEGLVIASQVNMNETYLSANTSDKELAKLGLEVVGKKLKTTNWSNEGIKAESTIIDSKGNLVGEMRTQKSTFSNR